MNGPGNVAEVGGYVVFEAFAADVLQQLLLLRNLGYARAAEGLERIVGEFTWTRVAANHAAAIIGRVARIYSTSPCRAISRMASKTSVCKHNNCMKLLQDALCPVATWLRQAS